MREEIKAIGLMAIISGLLLIFSCGQPGDEAQGSIADQFSSRPELEASSSDLKIGANTLSLYHFNKINYLPGALCGTYQTPDAVSGRTLMVGNGAKLSANTPFSSGKSIKFDGINDFLYNPTSSECVGHTHSLSNLAEGTVDAYVYVTGFSGTDCGIVYSQNVFELGIGTDRKVFVNLAGDILQSNKTLKLKKWYRLATTWDGANLKIYINGNLDNTLATAKGVGSSDTLRIGTIGSSYCWGYIDEVRISNAALYGN